MNDNAEKHSIKNVILKALRKSIAMFVVLMMAFSMLPISAFAEPAGAATVSVYGHTAFFSSIKMYSYTDAVKGETNILEGVTADNGTYTIETVTPGDYIIEGYTAGNASGDPEQLMGSIAVEVVEGANTFNLCAAYGIKANNSGWVLDTDYATQVTVGEPSGTPRNIIVGKVTKSNKEGYSCICLNGDTITATFTPDAELHPNFMPVTKSQTMTSNSSGITDVCKEWIEVTIHAPAGSEITFGTMAKYYVYSYLEPVSETTTESGVTAVFRPAKSTDYFYRVQNPNGVTYWNYEKWTATTEITVTEADLFINDGSYTKNTVVKDFSNNKYDVGNIYLNINGAGYKNMSVGESFELNSFRNWFAIGNITANDKVALPDMHYRVLGLDGQPSNVVTIEPNAINSNVATMTANQSGTAIVLVSYDAMYSVDAVGGSKFSASWPELTGVFVVSVGADGTGIQTNMVMDRLGSTTDGEALRIDAEHDILFYTGNEGASFSFTPEAGCSVSVARSTVGTEMNFSGFTTSDVTVAENGEVTVNGLTSGRHIVRVEKGGVANYQVITAKEVTCAITKDGNPVDESNPVKAGDKVTVQFTGLLNPKEKLSGAYNFNFKLEYKGEDGESLFNGTPGSNFGYYEFSSNADRQKVDITIPKYWDGETFTLNGALRQGGFAGVPTHRGITYAAGTNPAFTAPPAAGVLSRLPELTIALAPTNFLTGTLNFKDEEQVTIARTDLTVSLKDNANNSIVVAENGTFPCVAGDYSYAVSGAGVEYKTGTVTVTEDGSNVFDITLKRTNAAAWDGTTLTEPQQDESGVYLISNGAEMAWFVAQVEANKENVSGKLTADIDMAGYPITNKLSTSSKEIVFDGNGFEIKGLNVTGALFNSIGNNSAIRNVIARGKATQAGIVGYAYGNNAVVENCKNYVDVTGTASAAGVVYKARVATISNCVNYGAINTTGSSEAAGIVATFVGKSTVSGCYNEGTITSGSGFAGGVFGTTGYAATIRNCYNKGAVSSGAADKAGGIGGKADGASSAKLLVENCYSVGAVSENGHGGFGTVNASRTTLAKCFVLAADDHAEVVSDAEMRSADLGEAFVKVCHDYPVLSWQSGYTAHTPEENPTVVAPTCVEKGYTEYTCANCHETYRSEYVDKLGHSWCEHATEEACADSTDCVYTAPDCTNEGSIVRTCLREGCNETHTDVLEALGHTSEEVSRTIYPAYYEATCSRCTVNYRVWNDDRLQGLTLPTENASNITMSDTGAYPWKLNGANLESSNQAANSSESNTALSFTLTTAGSLSFDYQVSSESRYDKLTITLAKEGGETTTVADAISGEVSDSFTQELSAGTYTLLMKYAKDSSGNNGSDTAYIKNLVLVASAPTPVTATVDFTSQTANAFLHAPATDVSVSSDLAETYGYTDGIVFNEGVSALDVLVKAHEVMFAEAFTAETKGDYLVVSASGMVSKLFGEATSANGFYINNAYPHDGTASQWGGYNGYVINNAPVATGDLVEFFIYQDQTYWSDSYGWIEQNGEAFTEISGYAGRNIDLTVKSAMVMMGYSYLDRAAMVAAGEAVEAAQLATVDLQTGALTDITGAVTDANGNVSIKLPTAGEYMIVAYMPEEEQTTSYASPLVMTLAKVNVSDFNFTIGDVDDSGVIDNLDANLVYAHYNTASASELTEAQLICADVNEDGAVDNQDAALIYAYYNNKITSFPTQSNN